MDLVRLFLGSSVAIVAGCASAPDPQVSRSYDLAFTHPAPYATYLQVTPGSPGAALPDPQDIVSPEFSLYLRKATGCVLDRSRPAAAIGGKTVPAGYMVPTSCPQY